MPRPKHSPSNPVNFTMFSLEMKDLAKDLISTYKNQTIERIKEGHRPYTVLTFVRINRPGLSRYERKHVAQYLADYLTKEGWVAGSGLLNIKEPHPEELYGFYPNSDTATFFSR